MKKIIYCALAFAAGLFASSCQQENLEPVAGGNTVTYTVELPGVDTKAIGDGSNINQLVYEVWRTENPNDVTLEPGAKTELLYRVADKPMANGSTIIELDLVNDQNYTILFWAQVRDGGYYNTEDLRNVTLTNKSSNAFEENRAAFYGVDFIKATDQRKVKQTVALTRPFGQVNLGTERRTPEQQAVYELKVVKTAATVKGASAVFNVATGVASATERVDMKFTAVTPLLSQELNDEYQWISMNYVFVPANQATFEVDYTIETNHGDVTNTISNIPAKKNYRTNIVGNLLTSKTEYTVNLDTRWDGADFNTTVIEEGIVVNANGDYEVSTPHGLAYMLNNLFKENHVLAEGGNFYLTAAEYDMTDMIVESPSVPAGKTLNIYGETPVVTRSTTGFAGITIKGLTQPLIGTVSGEVSVSGVTVTKEKSEEVSVLIEEIDDNATVVVSKVVVETIANEGEDNVLSASEVETLEQLQTALASGVKEINVVAGKNFTITDELTLNINGKTIIGVDNITASYGLITVDPEAQLTINGPGKIVLSAENDRGWNAYSSVISNQRGTLTVNEGVVIEHLGGTAMAYGIDNLTNSDEKDAVTIVNGATVKSTYRAIRQFLNSTNADNELYVYEGSEIIGENKSIWSQNANSGANPGKTVVVADAKLTGDVMLSASGATEWPVEVSIAASALVSPSTVVPSNVSELYSVVEENGFWTVKTNEATVGETKYSTLVEAVAEAESGATITLLSNVTLSESLTLPAGITLNGNGKQINGTIVAGGNLTIAGHVKVTSFSAGYYNRIITIGEGACLEVTGGGRVSLAYGNTFNITGNIEDAKTADEANVQASLIIPAGISITGGNGATMNVTNAYVKIGSTTSKPGEANGKFTLNFNNSIAEFTKEFGFYAPTGGKTPEFEMNIENSVFTTAAKLCVATSNSVINVENSNVTLGTYLRNSGEINLTGGSVLTGATIQFGENGGNDGSITVDNSSFTILGRSAAHAFDGRGVGSITAKNKAVVEIDYVKDMILKVGNDCSFTYTKLDNCFEVVTNAEELTSAFKEGKNVILYEDIYSEASTTAPYGNKYGYKMDGGVLDGNGYELDIECYGDDYGIMTSGGTIKNLKIDNGTRAIMVMYVNEDLTLDNVNIGGDGVLYPINTGEAGPAAETAKLTVSNSTLAGWTSYSFFASATFTNVEFKQGTYYNNIYGRVLKPYVNTTLTNCSFVEHMNLDLSGLANGHKVTMTNCTVNGQAVTAEVMTVPSSDAEYDTKLFTVDLPSWATSINDCIIFN